jgi:hypothetical protein
MTNQSNLDELRRRLLAVLRARLAEAEDDEARQAAWEAINWDKYSEATCSRCGHEAFRLMEGRCIVCYRKGQEEAYDLVRRLALVQKRYPKLTRGLRKSLDILRKQTKEAGTH